MISHRTRLSLVQLLAQQDEAGVATLLAKYGAQLQYRGFAHDVVAAGRGAREQSGDEVVLHRRRAGQARLGAAQHPLPGLIAVQQQAALEVGEALVEGRLRADRLAQRAAGGHRLCRKGQRLLGGQRLHHFAQALGEVQDSAQAFRAAPPDYNAALTNARVALETMARDVAADLLQPGEAAPYDPAKWGSVITIGGRVAGTDDAAGANLCVEHVLVPVAQPLGAAGCVGVAIGKEMTMSEYQHALVKVLEAAAAGEKGPGPLSTGEKLMGALALNRPDWLAQMGYTIVEALERIGEEWCQMLPQVARAAAAEHRASARRVNSPSRRWPSLSCRQAAAASSRRFTAGPRW